MNIAIDLLSAETRFGVMKDLLSLKEQVDLDDKNTEYIEAILCELGEYIVNELGLETGDPIPAGMMMYFMTPLAKQIKNAKLKV